MINKLIAGQESAGVYILVICEKPAAARRIAHALGSPKEQRSAGGVSVFDVASGDGSRYKIVSALGHLYGLTDVTASRSVYPVLDLEWAPLQKNARAIASIKVISELAKNASAFVHACDYDQEGEVIGYSILEYACDRQYGKSKRAKFSTLTDDEIRDAFANLIPSPIAGMAQAGRCRHMLDYLFGINLSRALSQSFKRTGGGYRNLSIGRVQGPTLAFVVDREAQIKLHIPDPFWTIEAKLAKGGDGFIARYSRPRIDTLAEAREIHKVCTNSSATVTGVEDRKVTLRPPAPFNVGDLQREAYRLFKLSPGYTLSIAEKLYLHALISYPRTSSQKLPASIGYSNIISALSNTNSYRRLALILLSKASLAPSEGKMWDPAHPAIYPTGVSPRVKLGGLEFKVYDLIVKRFLSTFGDPATTLRTDVAIDIGGHRFGAEGEKILYDGWMIFYTPYLGKASHYRDLPPMMTGDRLDNLGIKMQAEFAQPPRRYNQASLLAKMEQEELGTKATRADIIATLLKRKYVVSSREGLLATDLGLAVIESMKEYVPSIISTNLTRGMEGQLEKIEVGDANVSAIELAVDRLVESLSSFMGSEVEIGAAIGEAASSDRSHDVAIGPCPVCKTGRLCVITSWKTKKRFVGCSNYAEAGLECKASMPLPQRGGIRPTSKRCTHCDWPVIGVVFARRSKQWRICVNIACPSKNKPHVQTL